MAFPVLNMLSYWFMWPAIACFACALGLAPNWLNETFLQLGMEKLVVRGGLIAGAANGWTSYPLLSALEQASPSSGAAQTWWLIAVTFVGVSSMMGSVNYMTTIINMRAPGMTLFRKPLTIWSMFITAILQAFA